MTDQEFVKSIGEDILLTCPDYCKTIFNRDGAFCLDMVNGLLYFKLTVSFYNSEPSEDIYTYMLSIAADTVDRYRHRLRTLTGQPERYCLSEAS